MPERIAILFLSVITMTDNGCQGLPSYTGTLKKNAIKRNVVYVLFRLNWRNGDWDWLRSEFPDCVKYWPRGSEMLGQVMLEDNRILSFPQSVMDAIGTVDDITQSSVVFSAFAGEDKDKWIENFLQGSKLIVELQRRFTKAQGPDCNIVYVVDYIPGYWEDDELFK